tara:strand:- start:183 stop:401 length:219 start_codon:yes stop_codon:yes gene_type:complete
MVSNVLLGVIVSALMFQLGFYPSGLLEGFDETSSLVIWITLGGLVGLLLGLLVKGITWIIRTLSGNWTRIGR